MKNRIIIICLNFFMLVTAYGAATYDDLMPEFAGRGNIMAAAELCSLNGRDAFQKQTMDLIHDSGLSVAEQNKLKQVFDDEYKEGLKFYKKNHDPESCNAIKDGIKPFTAEEYKKWKLMTLE